MICHDGDGNELEFPLVFAVVLIVLFLFCNVVVLLHG